MAGALQATISAIHQRCNHSPYGRRPDGTLLLGDQVYLDLPTLRNFPDNAMLLAKDFEYKYANNWFAHEHQLDLSTLLSSAPSIAIPDDHEFWNNYPHVSPIIQNSWTESGRAAWRTAAQACFAGFQAPAGVSLGKAVQIDIPPLSFFIADTRGARTERRLLTADALNALKAWSKKLEETKRVGVFVSGQSLLAKQSGQFSGAAKDWEMPNYDDFSEIVDSLITGRQPLFLITGDVHWGRVAQAKSPSAAFAEKPMRSLHEVIVSPAALVRAVGFDGWTTFSDSVISFFGGTVDRWSRHADPAASVSDIGPIRHRYDSQARWRVPHKLKGDQLGLLSFSMTTKLTVQLQLWNIGDKQPAVNANLLSVPIT